MSYDKIISFDGLLDNQEYQANLAKKTDEIMGDTYEMNTNQFLESKKFESIFTMAENVNIDEIKNAVKDIVGKNITKRELNMILALMDSNLENIKNKDGQAEEKFVMDSVLHIAKSCGLFQATGHEQTKLRNRSHYFQESNIPIAVRDEKNPETTADDTFTMKYEDGTVIWQYDNSGKTFVSLKLLEYVRRLFFTDAKQEQPQIQE